MYSKHSSGYSMFTQLSDIIDHRSKYYKLRQLCSIYCRCLRFAGHVENITWLKIFLKLDL